MGTGLVAGRRKNCILRSQDITHAKLTICFLFSSVTSLKSGHSSGEVTKGYPMLHVPACFPALHPHRT